MQIGQLNTCDKVIIVAEIGNNHEGNIDMARRLIHAAAESGVDAVKFQVFRAQWLVGRSNQKRYEQLKSYELSFQQFEQLHAEAQQVGVLFLATPFDMECACFLNTFVSALKIASGDNTFYPLLKTVAGFGKPVLLSSGMLDIHAIATVKQYIERQAAEQGISTPLAVLHCVGAYPVPDEDANLNAIGVLKAALQCDIGYSDHTLGIEAAVLAVAAGARIIEKHFTLDKNTSAFRDHQLSADPKDMARMVQRIRRTELLMGNGSKDIRPAEADNATTLRRSIISRTDIPAGSEIRWDHLAWVRPGEGLPPGQEEQLLGKRVIQDIKAGHVFQPDDFTIV